MSANTKILVFKKKEVLYTLIFAVLAVVLIFLLFTMFRGEQTASPTSAEVSAAYVPGIYTSVLSLGTQSLEVEVCVDDNHINSVRFVSLDESVTTVYPLMGPSMESLSEQIIANQSADNISYAESSKYTCSAILTAVRAALAKAVAN